MRHEADDIAWHAREVAAAAAQAPAGATLVRTRRSPVGEGLQVLVHASGRRDLFARICGYFDRADFSIQDAKIHTASDGWALDSFQLVSELLPERAPALMARIEAELPAAVDSSQQLPPPRLGRVSTRVRSFPVAPRVDLRPDEKAQNWLLSVSAGDRTGLLYSIARVLAAHAISVELAKITTLGERVEDVFLLRGEQLQEARTRVAIEQELLQALAPT